MKKLTVIAGENGTRNVCVKMKTEKTVNDRIVTVVSSCTLPVGVEIPVSDDLYHAAVTQYDCIVGFTVDTETDIADLPTATVSDGSYVFILSTQTKKYLSNGVWLPGATQTSTTIFEHTFAQGDWDVGSNYIEVYTSDFEVSQGDIVDVYWNDELHENLTVDSEDGVFCIAYDDTQILVDPSEQTSSISVTDCTQPEQVVLVIKKHNA